MNIFDNDKEISIIKIRKNLCFYCPLGKDYYSANININVEPNNKLVDFLDIEKFFTEIQGSKLIIEDAVSCIFNFINNSYNPKHITINIKADSNVHFPVEVIKEK